MPTVDELLKKQEPKASQMGIQQKKIKREGPTRPWESSKSNFEVRSEPAIPVLQKSPEPSPKPIPPVKKNEPLEAKPKEIDLITKEIPEPVVKMKAPVLTSASQEMARHFQQNGMPLILDGTPDLKNGMPDDLPMARHFQAPERKLSRRHLEVIYALKRRIIERGETAPFIYKDIETETGIPTRSFSRVMTDLTAKGYISEPTLGPKTGWRMGRQTSIVICNERKMNDALTDAFIMTGQNDLPMARQIGRSSSNINFNNSNTTTYSESGMPLFVEEIDLSKLPWIDRQKLRKYLRKYQTREALQDFVDRVAFAIENQKGTKNEVRHPGAFIDSCYERGVDVSGTYRSRDQLKEEEDLKREQEELENFKRIRDERKKIEGEKLKFTFEDWFENAAKDRMQEFEKERALTYPEIQGFPIPRQVKMKQIREVAASTFVFENGISPSMSGVLI